MKTFIRMQHGKWFGCGRSAVGTPRRKQLILLLRNFKKNPRTRRLFLWVINYDHEECSRGLGMVRSSLWLKPRVCVVVRERKDGYWHDETGRGRWVRSHRAGHAPPRAKNRRRTLSRVEQTRSLRAG